MNGFRKASLFSSRIAAVRSEIFKRACLALMLICFALMIFCLVMLGASWDLSSRLNQVDVAITNLDPDRFGTDISNFLKRGFPATNPHIFDKPATSLADVSNQIQTGSIRYWIFIPPTVSSTIYLALNRSIPSTTTTTTANTTTPLPPFSNPVYFVFDEAAQSMLATTLRMYFNRLFSSASYTTAMSVVRTAAQLNANLSVIDPNVLARPVSFVEMNLHPVGKTGMSFVSSFIFVVLFTFGTITATIQDSLVRQTMAKFVRSSYTRLFGVMLETIMTSVQALVVMLVLLGYAGADSPLVSRFGNYWALVWLFISTCTSFVYFTKLLHPALSSVIIGVMAVVQMASTDVQQPLALQHPFFQVGYALPVYHAACVARYILFDTGDTLGLNLGVLFAWWGLSKTGLGLLAGYHYSSQQPLPEDLQKLDQPQSRAVHDADKSIEMSEKNVTKSPQPNVEANSQVNVEIQLEDEPEEENIQQIGEGR